MNLRVLVAKMDGKGGKQPFMPGSILPPSETIVVERNFDGRQPIGWATLFVEDTDVYADITLNDGEDPRGLTPALSGVYRIGILREGRECIDFFEVLSLWLLDQPNADERIPAISVAYEEPR